MYERGGVVEKIYKRSYVLIEELSCSKENRKSVLAPSAAKFAAFSPLRIPVLQPVLQVFPHLRIRV